MFSRIIKTLPEFLRTHRLSWYYYFNVSKKLLLKKLLWLNIQELAKNSGRVFKTHPATAC